MKNTYVVLARLPPPLGGVSVFAHRKIKKLEADGHRVLIVNFASKYWILRLVYYAVFHRKAEFHVNSLRLGLLAGLYLLGLLPRVSLYDHNHSRHFRPGSRQYQVYRFLARHVKEVVVVHEHIRKFYHGVGVRTRVESPFIPPDPADEQRVCATYPSWVRNFISQAEGLCLLNSAWRYIKLQSGGDLYGVDSSLKLLRRLRENGFAARLIFAFGELDFSEVPQSIRRLIEQLENEGALRLLVGQFEIWPLFKQVDGFLRTTATDGESVSVLEALHFGCPVVASDAVPRPQGVATYRYGDFDHLFEVVVRTFIIQAG